MIEFFTKKRISGWLKRYTYPMVLATIAEFLSAIISYQISGDFIVAALVATVVGNLVFYVLMAYSEAREIKTKNKEFTLKDILKVTRNLTIEFGPAEYLDSYVFRPALIAVCPMFITPYSLGALTGAVIAEVIYAVVVLFSYETRKRVIR